MTAERKGLNRFGCAAWIVAIAIVAAIWYFNSGSSSSATATATPAPDSATRLASLQAGGSVPSGDPLIAQFQSALDSIAPHCTQSEDEVAALTASSHDDLIKNGVSESYLSVLKHVGYSIQDLNNPVDCQSMFAAYLVLREPK
jgi:hypothetical protein